MTNGHGDLLLAVVFCTVQVRISGLGEYVQEGTNRGSFPNGMEISSMHLPTAIRRRSISRIRQQDA